MKIFLSLTMMLVLCNNIFGQQTFYYDSLWSKVNKEFADLREEKERKGNLYQRKMYYVSNNLLYTIASYSDSNYYNPVGLYKNYYKNGALKDSAYYNDSSKKLFGFHYTEQGKMIATYTFNELTQEETIRGYDENGNILPSFIYEQEASFPGDLAAWKKHLTRYINPNVSVKNKAPAGIYKVIVRFIVARDGTISDIMAETQHGYGMEAEAIKVIRKSPKWNPAVQYNKTVNAYRRQPITFVVQ